MKLLFDENLAARLAKDLDGVFPGSAHVETLGLLGATDRIVWSRAADGGFVLVTKDEDFHRLSSRLRRAEVPAPDAQGDLFLTTFTARAGLTPCSMRWRAG